MHHGQYLKTYSANEDPEIWLKAKDKYCEWTLYQDCFDNVSKCVLFSLSGELDKNTDSASRCLISVLKVKYYLWTSCFPNQLQVVGSCLPYRPEVSHIYLLI